MIGRMGLSMRDVMSRLSIVNAAVHQQQTVGDPIRRVVTSAVGKISDTVSGVMIASREHAQRKAVQSASNLMNMGKEEAKALQGRQLKKNVLRGIGSGAVLGVGAGIAGAGLAGVASRRQYLTGEEPPALEVGYPGTTGGRSVNMGADGDLVHALHNIHGTGKNR